MLHGVGGRTIEEAKRRMTYQEYLTWVAYRNKWGGLHVGMRIDRAVGRAAAFFANAMSRRRDIKWQDFSPHDQQAERREQERILNDPEAFAAKLKAIARRQA